MHMNKACNNGFESAVMKNFTYFDASILVFSKDLLSEQWCEREKSDSKHMIHDCT